MPLHVPPPQPVRRSPRRPADAYRIQFQNRDAAAESLHSHVTVVPVETGFTVDFGFRINSFQIRRLRQTGIALIAAALLPLAASAQSLWRPDGSTKTMFTDKKATAVGDIITIVVQENTSTSKDNKTSTSKSSGVDANLSTLLFSPGAGNMLTKGGQLPALKFDSKNDYEGGGKIANSENIVTRVAVRVIDVMPNNTMLVEGRRETSFSGEKQTIVLRGVVRAEDVTSANTVMSYNVADASIQIVGKGTLSNSQKKGWFTRVWDKISPF